MTYYTELIGRLKKFRGMWMGDGMHPSIERQALIDALEAQAREIEALRADAERWRSLLERSLPMLKEHSDYANSAPVWHCTGYEANTLNELIPEIEATLHSAMQAGKAVTTMKTPNAQANLTDTAR